MRSFDAEKRKKGITPNIKLGAFGLSKVTPEVKDFGG
jgi:hypothetical protein